MNNAIFQGNVRHRRFLHCCHQFQYRLFMLHLDLAACEEIFADYWLWSYNKCNVANFQRHRYLGDPQQSLLESVKDLLQAKVGIVPERVFLLTQLAYYGVCFNPISLYFCWYQQQLTHCVVEVTNTPWREQHVYVVAMKPLRDDLYEADFAKCLHVSPFMAMDYRYKMRCKYSAQQIIVHIENWRQHCDFDATLSLRAQPLNHRNLAKILLQFPFVSGKVIAAIHWQALRLWLKKVPIFDHPGKQHDRASKK